MRLLKDPTVHFAVLGAALFALWAVAGEEEPLENPERTVVVSQERVEQLRRDYTLRTGQPPGQETLEGLVDNWVTEEVLFREALALGLHQSDEIVRRRLIQVMGFLLEDLAPIDDPDEDELRAWYREHQDRYSKSARISFDHVFFSSGDSRARAEEALANLSDWKSLGDPFISGRQFQKRSQAQVATLFGNDFAATLFSGDLTQPGQWAGPVESALGWHLIRVRAVEADDTLPFEQVRDRVRDHWQEAQRDKANAAAVRSLKRRYTVQRQDEDAAANGQAETGAP